MSHEQPTRGSFPRGGRRGGGFRPDFGNRYYVRGSPNTRGRRGGSGPAAPPSFPPGADIKEGLDMSKIIETIPAPARPTAPAAALPIENVKYLASYNWDDTEKPTIVVPGSPPQWTGRALPFTLQPDDGSNFIDQNNAHSSEYPMLPLFTAADAIHGKKAPVDWPTVDVITDRNGLRKLLRWLSPSAGREVRDFRIDVDLIGTKTILLGRWEDRMHHPPNGRSFGFAFEAATTRPAPGCPSSGHHRAITYDMHDMKMIVRFEVDACLPTDAGPVTATKTADEKRSTKETAASVDDLVDALGSMDLLGSAPAMTKELINVVRAGTQVPQEALVEVASRSTYFVDQLDWNELYPQLAISQTHEFRLGVHERGTFTQLREWQIDYPGSGSSSSDSGMPDLTAQRKELAMQMVRLARVLEDVQELAISRGPGPAGSFSLVCVDGKLRVYERSNKNKTCLPPDVMARFSGSED
ncbi:hypothetical protein BJV78DRAFT_152208 [Lactifluus subvellereus]|nr:hypothetical protein BJV78DRAFT_152208 [Lactifluus subvellereus]